MFPNTLATHHNVSVLWCFQFEHLAKILSLDLHEAPHGIPW